MGDMLRCGTCRFWGKQGEEGGEFRPCTRMVHDGDSLTRDEKFMDFDYDDHGEYVGTVTLTDEAVRFRAEHRAVVQDGSGYFAALKTRDDFGCVEYQPV